MNIATRLKTDKPFAKIKGKPEHFQVQEVTSSGSKVFPFFKTTIGAPEQFFTKFQMTKKGVTHERAMRIIAGQLKVERGQITTHGKKDACAVTVQELVVEGAYTPTFEHNSVWLRQIGAASRKLYRGANTGNYFTIFAETDNEIAPVANRFLNLYGPQRFGDEEYPQTGRLMLEQRFEEAAQLLLQSRMNGSEFARVRAAYDSAEAAIVSPEFTKTRKWKLQQFQSYLWNQLAPATTEAKLPLWSRETLGLYADYYWPEEGFDELLEAEMRQPHYLRPVWVYPKDHQVMKVPGGFRHRFELRSGAYATQFLDEIYDYVDVSRERFENKGN